MITVYLVMYSSNKKVIYVPSCYSQTRTFTLKNLVYVVEYMIKYDYH